MPQIKPLGPIPFSGGTIGPPMPVMVPTPSGHQVVVPEWMQPAAISAPAPVNEMFAWRQLPPAPSAPAPAVSTILGTPAQTLPPAVIANIVGGAPDIARGIGESAAGAVRDATLRQGVKGIVRTMSPATSPLVHRAVDDFVAHVLGKGKSDGRS